MLTWELMHVISQVVVNIFEFLPIPDTPDVLYEIWEFFEVYFLDAIEFISCFFLPDHFKLVVTMCAGTWVVRKGYVGSHYVYHHIRGNN